jgi:hypothetical protein
MIPITTQMSIVEQNAAKAWNEWGSWSLARELQLNDGDTEAAKVSDGLADMWWRAWNDAEAAIRCERAATDDVVTITNLYARVGSGALDGYALSCTCGWTATTSLHSLSRSHASAHIAWHRKEGR